jgi:hypothetical protein
MTHTCLADLYCQDLVHPTPTSIPTSGLADTVVKDHPFQPRPLTRPERRADDLHAFQSPKEKRRIEVIGVTALGLALLLEFNPNIVAYIERPRVIETSAGRHELSFWIRNKQGRERFLFIVPTSASQPGQNGRRIHRRTEALLEAARRAEIQLIFVSEPDLLDQRMRITQALRMLAYVQDVQRLPNRLYLRERVRANFELSARARFSDVAQSMPEFVASDIRAVVCDLVHQGELTIDPSTSLTMHAIVSKGGCHA